DFQVSPAGANTWNTVGTSTGPVYSASFDTTTLTDGHYDFRTVAYDVAGNQTASTPVTNRLVDNTPPVVQIVDPGANLRGTVLLATNPAGTNDPGANASGIVSTSYEVSSDGGATWQPVGASWNTTGGPDGLYDIRATVTDAAGNVSAPSVVTARRVDNTPPSTTASGVPSGYSATDVTVTLTPTDGGSGVSDTLYSVDNGPTQHGTSVLIPAPSNGSNDGSHTISFQSVDVAGNVESSHSVVVLIDATPPACPSCSASDYMRGTVTLSATPTSLSGIASVAFEYSHDGTTWTTIGTDSTGSSGTYSTSWDTTGVADDTYHLRAKVTDNATNVAYIDLHSGGAGVVVVDNTAPTAAVGSPAGGSFVSGNSVTIAASASDANPLTYAFLVNGSVIASGAAASTSWDSTSVGDGPVSIQVRATDPAGNSTTSAPVTVNVDNHAPSPTVNNPGAAVSGTPTISATTDADTSTVEFQYRLQGGSSWTSIATVGPPFSTPFTTTSLSDGTYELRAIATDQAGHVGTSPIVTVLVDNTNPTGSITTPLAGQTIGGPATPLAATASDAGSGIASVQFEYAPHGTNTWSPIATVTSAPYQTSWDASAVPTAQYDLRVVVTDNAGNVHTSAAMLVKVDSTAPTVNLTSPGALVSGTIPLTATTSGPAAVSVTFQVSPQGANTWQTISVDTASPWSVSFDTTTVPDGVYDVRAVAVDSLGNQGKDVQTPVQIDNTPPSIVSSAPVDGTSPQSANSISFDASEIVTLSGVTLDGASTVAPTITGTHVDFTTGALTPGPHTLAGTLDDTAGKSTPFRIHFTVYPTATTPAPYTEKNASLAHSTTLDSADGNSSLTMPANAWTGGNPSDWLVIRVAPEQPSAAPATSMPLTSVVDASAYWALAGGLVHSFAQPLDVQIDGAGGGSLAATYDGTSWRMIQQVPTAGQLPNGWTDGYWVAGGTMHILTRHLSLFALTGDTQAPTPPTSVSASVNDGNLTLYWGAGSDNSGSIANYVFFIDGKPVKNLGGTELQYTVGPYDPNDSHTYSIVAQDANGNSSEPVTVRLVPSIAGLSLDAARAALIAAGFTVGDVTVADSSAPAGTVISPSGLTLAAPGSAIAIQLAGGGSTVQPKWGFGLIGTGRLPLAQRKFIGVRFASNGASTFTVTLLTKKHKALKTWHFQFRAGIGIRKLYLPKKARHTGWYSLRWTAVSGSTVLHRTFGLQIVKSIHTPLPKSKKRVDVVMAGAGLPTHLPPGTKQAARVVAGSDSSAWSFTA
ncbi:MAG TPA: Ig-like domain-containing protein, partial [Gaiellaceae bacterium]|nr:Ig-like domain-containing protein [Gaiellaceae bacterium]